MNGWKERITFFVSYLAKYVCVWIQIHLNKSFSENYCLPTVWCCVIYTKPVMCKRLFACLKLIFIYLYLWSSSLSLWDLTNGCLSSIYRKLLIILSTALSNSFVAAGQAAQSSFGRRKCRCRRRRRRQGRSIQTGSWSKNRDDVGSMARDSVSARTEVSARSDPVHSHLPNPTRPSNSQHLK